jgi:heme/copper-type cytochrome/quinol oxidase subunit 3
VAEASSPQQPAIRVPPVPLGVAIPPEPPEVGARQLYVAGRLLAGSTAFFFLDFVFAYFYLRSLNQDHAWRPKGIGPEQGLGVAIVLLLVASAAFAVYSGRLMSRVRRNWLTMAEVALLLGGAAIVLQCIEWATQNFGPASGAYASVYCGWTAFYTLGALMTLLWLETHVATEIRSRNQPVPAREGDIDRPDWLIKPGLDASIFFWSFLVGIGVLTWVVLYLV